MREDLKKLSFELDRRPISAQDLEVLRRHAQNTQHASEVARAAKDHEPQIVPPTIYKLYRKYPGVKAGFENCVAKTNRDMKLVFRYSLYSVILDDPEWARQKMFLWFKTILDAFDFGRPFITDAYRMMQGQMREVVPEPEAEPMCRMVDEAIAVFNS